MKKITATSNSIILSVPFKITDKFTPIYPGMERCVSILAQFHNFIIQALQDRKEACFNNMIKHIHDDDIIINADQIIYARQDGTTHAFNIHNYNMMIDIIELMRAKKYEEVLHHVEMVDQIIKATWWTDKPEDIKGKFKASDLLSMLMEIHIFGINPNE